MTDAGIKQPLAGTPRRVPDNHFSTRVMRLRPTIGRAMSRP